MWYVVWLPVRIPRLPLFTQFSLYHPIDQTLLGVTGIFNEAFPGRVRSVYLVGSQADGSAVGLSDVDIRVIFRDCFQGEAEIERFLRVRQYLRLLSPVEIDCPPLDEARLRSNEDWLHETLSIKFASRLLYGEDIRETLPDVPLEAFLRNVTRAPLHFMTRLHGIDPLPDPLDYPNPQGAFFGYDMPDVKTGRSLKMLVHVAGFIATSRIGLETGQMVVQKSDWLPMYRSHIHDEWTPLLEALWKQCKENWGYHVPEHPEERAVLRELCAQFLQFENNYLERYRKIVLC